MTDVVADPLKRGLGALLAAQDADFVTLARLSGLSPETDFRRADLSGADLRDQDLRAFEFSRACFRGARIAGALFNASVSQAQLSEAEDYDTMSVAGLASFGAWMIPDTRVYERQLVVDLEAGVVRIGEGGPVSFDLSLRRCEVVVIVPSSEPAIARVWGRDTLGSQSKDDRTALVAAKPSDQLPASSKSSVSSVFRGDFLVPTPAIRLAPSPDVYDPGRIENRGRLTRSDDAAWSAPFVEREYRWEARANNKGRREGRPWRKKQWPLLSVIDSRADRSKGLPPRVLVELRLRRGDLIVSNLSSRLEATLSRQEQEALTQAEAAIRRLGFAPPPEGFAEPRLAEDELLLARIVPLFDDDDLPQIGEPPADLAEARARRAARGSSEAAD